MESTADGESFLACMDCGEPIEDVGLERGYLFAEEQALCYACAIARGGAYDELHDRWTKAPDVHGLFPDGDAEFGPRGVVP